MGVLEVGGMCGVLHLWKVIGKRFAFDYCDEEFMIQDL